MEAAALHPVPHWSVPVRRQHALLLESGRVRLLFLASIALPLLTRFALDERNDWRFSSLVRRGATRMADGSGVIFEGRAYFFEPTIVSAAPMFLLVPVLWALLVWRGEGRDRRAHHWSMPVAREAHDGWRVAAGAVWLIAATGLFALTGFGIGMLDGPAALLRYGATAWINLFTTPLLIYLALSIVMVLAARPLNWLIGIGLGFGALVMLMDRFHWTVLPDVLDPFITGRFGLETATTGGIQIAASYLDPRRLQPLFDRIGEFVYTPPPAPAVAEWVFAMSLWFAVVIGGIVLATRRRPG